MRDAFSFNGPNKLEKISFNNIVAMRISAVFECNSTNSTEELSYHQPRHRRGEFNSLKETEKENIRWQWRK